MWTRDKSADQSGPSIVGLPSGQSQSRQSKHWQAHNAGAGCLSHFELRTSYLSRGSSIPALKSDLRFLRCILYGRRNLSPSSRLRRKLGVASISLSSEEWAGLRASVPCVYCIPPLVGCSESVSIRVHPWFHSFVYALLFRSPIARRSTSIHERSACVHEQSLNVQPFWRPPSPQETGHRSPNPNPLSDNHPAFSLVRTSNLELL